MAKSKDNGALKFVLAFVAWVIGSAAVAGFLRSLSDASWVDVVALIFVVVWGITIIWFYRQVD